MVFSIEWLDQDLKLPMMREPRVIEVDDRDTLAALQKEIGGYVDCVRVSPTLDLWVHDEGLLMGLPSRVPSSGSCCDETLDSNATDLELDEMPFSPSSTKRSKHMAKKKTNYVVVRTYSAGVHVGELVERKGKEVTLANARRIWSWKGANTLHEVALRGVAAGSRVSETVPSVTLTEAIEVIQTAEAGEKALRGSTWQS